MKGTYILVFAVVVTVHESLVRSQPRSHAGLPRTSTRKGSRQRGDPSLTGFSFHANIGASNTRTKTKTGNRPSWNMDKWTNDMSRQRIPKPPPQNSINMQQWRSPFSYRSVSDDMYLNPAKHPPVLMRDTNSNGRSVPKSRPLKSKAVKKAITPAPAEVNPPVEEPLFSLQDASTYVVSESNLEQTTLAPAEPSSVAPSPSKIDYSKEQQNSESSVPLAVISQVQQSSSPAEFSPASEPSSQPKPTHTASVFAPDKVPASQNQQAKSTEIKSIPRPPRPPRPLPDTFHTDKRMSSSKQMTYRVFSSWRDAPGMQDPSGNKPRGKLTGTVSTLRPENKGATPASEVTFNQNTRMLSKSQEKTTSFALGAAEGLTGEMNPNLKKNPNKPELRYSNTVNLGNVKTSSGNQISYNNDIAITTPVLVHEKLQPPQEVESMKSLAQINSGNQQLVRQSHDFQSIKSSESSRHKITTSPKTKVTPRRNVVMSTYRYPSTSTSETKANQVYRAERRYSGNKHNPINISTKSEELLRPVAYQTASVGNIQEPTDISTHSNGIPKFSAPETSSLITSKERKGQIESHKLYGTRSQNISALAELRRVLSLNKLSLRGLGNVNPSNIKTDIFQKNLQNPEGKNKKDFVLENYRAQTGDTSETITTVFKTQPRKAEDSQKKNYLEPKHEVIESPRRGSTGHVDIELSGQDMIRTYNKHDGRSKQSLVNSSPTGQSYSKTEIVTLKQQGGDNSIATGKQDIQSGTTRQGNQARLIQDVNQHNADGISSAQISESFQKYFVSQKNLENTKSAEKRGHKMSYVLPDKQENLANRVDASSNKRIEYSKSGDSRDVVGAESQISSRSEAVPLKDYSAGPLKKPCDVAPVCGSDGFTYMSECFMWSGVLKTCDGFCPCKNKSPPQSKSQGTSTRNRENQQKTQNLPRSDSQGSQSPFRPDQPNANWLGSQPQNRQVPTQSGIQDHPPPDRQDPPRSGRQGPPLADRQDPSRSGRQDLPSLNRQGLPSPSGRQGPPPPDVQGLPISSGRQGPPPPDRQGLPPSSGRQGPPSLDRQGLPPLSGRQGPPPPDRQGLPPSSGRQGPPSLDRQGLPPLSGRQGPPPTDRQGLPPSSVRQGLSPLNKHGQMSTERRVSNVPPSCNCPNLRRPVCSVRNNTYENDCFRRCKNEEKDCNGECPCHTNKQRYDPKPNQYYDKPAPFDSQQGQYNSKYVTQDMNANQPVQNTHGTNANNFNTEPQTNQYGPNANNFNTEPQTNQYGPNPNNFNMEPQTKLYGPNANNINTEPQTNQYGPNANNFNTEPQTNQYGPNANNFNTEPQTNQYGPNPNNFNMEPQTKLYGPNPSNINTEPQTNQYGPNPNKFNTEPQTNQYGPNPNTESQTNQYGPTPNDFNTEPHTNQNGPNPNNFNTEPQTNQYGPNPNNLNKEPQTNQYGPNLNNFNTEPQTNQYGPNPNTFNTEPQTNQYGPNPNNFNTEPQTNQYGTNPNNFNTEPQTNQYGPNPNNFNTEPQTNQYGPNPNNLNTEPQTVQYGPNPNNFNTEQQTNQYGPNPNNFNTEPPTNPNNYFTEPQTNQYGTNPNNFNAEPPTNPNNYFTEPQTNQYGTNPNNFNAEPSNQPLSTCECGPGDIDPVCSTTGETIWYGCRAICSGVTIACSSECPC